MFRYIVFSIFITNFLLTFHGFQSEASSIHFLSTDILKEVEDHAQEKFKEYQDVKGSEYEYKEDGSKRRIQKREVQDDPQQLTLSKTTDKTTEKAAASPKKDSENRRRTIYRPRNRACRYRGRWIRCSQERASWRARAYPIRRNINYS